MNIPIDEYSFNNEIDKQIYFLDLKEKQLIKELEYLNIKREKLILSQMENNLEDSLINGGL